MTASFEQKIRERAYHIWVATGMIVGRAEEHWLSAERAVINEEALHGSARTKKASPRKAAPAVRKVPAKPRSTTTKKAAMLKN